MDETHLTDMPAGQEINGCYYITYVYIGFFKQHGFQTQKTVT
jgi:hypothetical protein